MKAFALIIASLFVFQTTVPALCMSGSEMEWAADASCCVTEDPEGCCKQQTMTCDFVEEEMACCAAEEMTSCTISEEDGIANQNHSDVPCKSCNIPCCSAPLCCFYFQETTDLNLCVEPVLLTGQLPAKNGNPHQGFRGDCFQPPEFI